MLWKPKTAFQPVAADEQEGIKTNDDSKREFYKPPATKPPLLIALLCSISACIALLQVAASQSVYHTDDGTLSPNLNKRQLVSLVTTYSEAVVTWPARAHTFVGATYTETWTTIIQSAWTSTDPAGTTTYPASTDTFYYLSTTISGSLETVPVELVTSDGIVSYSVLPTGGANNYASSADYLDFSTPSGSPISTVVEVHPPTAVFTSDAPVLPTTTAATILSFESQPAVASRTDSTAYIMTSSTPATSIATKSPIGVVNITTLPKTDRLLLGTFTQTRYYTAAYLCPLVVVLLKCVFDVIFASTKMIEPFHQLTRPGGANAKTSLLANYLSSGFSMSALPTLLTARPVMLAAILISATISIMSPIASETMSIHASQMCPQSDGTSRRCAPVWILNMPCVRVLQSLLSLVFCLIMAYLIMNLRRTSGIFHDPSSIASVASLLGNDDLVRELQEIPEHASKKEIAKSIAEKRYALATFTRDGGDIGYGLVRADESRGHKGYHVTNVQKPSIPKVKKRSSWKSRYLNDVCILLLSGGMLAVIVYYYTDFRDDAFNRFFNSAKFGPRFVLSTAAIVLDNRWKALEQEVRMMQPYRTLYRRSGPTASTEALLANTASTMHTSFATALWRGHLFLALVSLVAILADVLIIAVVGVPFDYGQVQSAFQVSTWLSISILSLMILTSLMTMLYWRWGNSRGMPREPNTLMNVMLYLCASQVREQLVPLSMESQKHRDQAVRSWHGRYWFRHALGVDGRSRWLIDRDEGRFEPSRSKGRDGERFA
ncbi:hypothetical protein H2200_005339 [Cladophialophora chaetospira]|uniref:Transmembrane protein n=1 Tax=Cladophialophora chaetospira TaxID=386627 RepID=A0AA39CJH9_9EURO|nr:hypothetical protein H2200_005339 [Cladophialophora chaetospira]